MKYTIEIQKSYEKCKKYAWNHWKRLFLAKTVIGKKTKKDQERQKRGGALIRAGAHIRDNTVSNNPVLLGFAVDDIDA